jgi:hypothetical protein
MKLAAIVLALSLPMLAQTPKKPATMLRPSFAKAGLKALIALEDDEETSLSGKTKEAMQAARAEYDPKNPSEARMFSNLTLFGVVRHINNLRRQAEDVKKDAIDEQERRCYEPIEAAFRERRSIAAPAACEKDAP